MTSIVKKAEELAREFNEAGHLKYDADEKPLAALIAAALRKERQEERGAAAERVRYAFCEECEQFGVCQEENYCDPLVAYRAAILKED